MPVKKLEKKLSLIKFDLESHLNLVRVTYFSTMILILAYNFKQDFKIIEVSLSSI